MRDELYFYVMMFGLIVVGLGWLWARKGNREAPSETEWIRVIEAWKKDSEQQLSQLASQIEQLQGELQSFKQEAARNNSESSTRNLKLDQRYGDIFELFQQGISTTEIAKRLEMGAGEVELIIQLHQLSSSAPSDKRRSAS